MFDHYLSCFILSGSSRSKSFNHRRENFSPKCRTRRCCLCQTHGQSLRRQKGSLWHQLYGSFGPIRTCHCHWKWKHGNDAISARIGNPTQGRYISSYSRGICGWRRTFVVFWRRKSQRRRCLLLGENWSSDGEFYTGCYSSYISSTQVRTFYEVDGGTTSYDGEIVNYIAVITKRG